jgi:hypothetical protein
MAALKQICLAACDVDDMDLAGTALLQLAVHISEDLAWFQRLKAGCMEAAGDYNSAMIMYKRC